MISQIVYRDDERYVITRSQEEIMLMNIAMRGVMSIQSGDNPRIVEQKLKIYVPPNMRDLAEDGA